MKHMSRLQPLLQTARMPGTAILLPLFSFTDLLVATACCWAWPENYPAPCLFGAVIKWAFAACSTSGGVSGCAQLTTLLICSMRI